MSDDELMIKTIGNFLLMLKQLINLLIKLINLLIVN